MLFDRTGSRLAAGLLVLWMAVPAAAQDLRGVKLFAPAELSPYGSGPQPKEGYFFVFEGLDWSIQSPEKTTIGFPNLTRNVFYGPLVTDMVVQGNTLDTGTFRDEFTTGNRIEVGRIVDCNGWFLSTYRLNRQTQDITSSAVDMVFFDPEFGPQGTKLLEGVVGQDAQGNDVIRDLPLTFDDVFIRNTVETWSIELNCVQRWRPFHHGGVLEWFAGVRYMEFDDTFDVDARARAEEEDDDDDDGDGPRQVPPILADSLWDTEAENHIVGPQVGVRLFKKRGRWMISSEGRFLAGFNSQNLRQRGTLGTELDPPGALFQPRLMNTTSFNHAEHLREWSPAVELRAEIRYQLTRAISFRAGWTGLYVDGIARASNIINYEVPDMGLLPRHNRQSLFMHGWAIGVDVNR